MQNEWPNSKTLRSRNCCDPGWASQFPLRTQGRHIVNSHGERFKLRGVNWYGASDVLHVVGGINHQNLEVICETIWDLGFKAVRLPFSNEMLRTGVPTDGSIDYSKNPRLRGLTALEVYDEVVRSLGRHKVAVIINNHTTYGEFCGPPSKNSLWFDGLDFTEGQWMRDWIMMAQRYARLPHVVGYDLRNEIRPRKMSWPFWDARPINGALSGECNWARSSTDLAEKLVTVSEALIVVERIVWPQRGLKHMVETPGPLLPRLRGRLVLGAHFYQWSGPKRFVPRWSEPACFRGLFSCMRLTGIITRDNYGDMSEAMLRRQVQDEIGGVLDQNICPVWISEFGASLDNEEEMQWFKRFVDVISELDADWAYWPLNVGLKPGSSCDEAYGMLCPDWRPKEFGDYRLRLLGKVGLEVPEGSMAPKLVPDSPQSFPHTRRGSQEQLRSLMSSKDPLCAVKSINTTRRSINHSPSAHKVNDLRRVRTAASMTSFLTSVLGPMPSRQRSNSAGPAFQTEDAEPSHVPLRAAS